MFNIGFTELIIILAVALIFLGPQRFPEIASMLGKSMSELRKIVDGFRDAVTAKGHEEESPSWKKEAPPFPKKDEPASGSGNPPAPAG